MTEDLFEQGEVIEKSSAIIIVVVALIAVLLFYSGVIKSIGESLNLSEGVSAFLFAALVNLGLVLYQVNVGKVINRMCKRPYI